LRLIIPELDITGPAIESYRCSECVWRHVVQHSEPFTVYYPEAEQACREFDQHSCAEFPACEGALYQAADVKINLLRARRVYDSRLTTIRKLTGNLQ
jgi:hypothetical protein